ncbi:mitochondrial matrix Mmp37 [Cutaneotrichosporon oleaginosum]|uniref:Phosphatidate cytidylyltransferase, mitochondrial n=1 Tax=Cutaneotrichosporon oleaginosum TaxID=879819 RepID=A0A0J0XHL8_9TREE|nr:mitochondrial matrix Mmp37 [Cutaneotrichosporon oleaginosum]KLT40620.1 mitochondrial matrix Mmp37 [Cutaneotrichosporon oleaginosum]
MSRTLLAPLAPFAPILSGPSRCGYIPLRAFSTSRAPRDAARDAEKAALAEEQKRIYAQFRPVVDAFDAPIDMAVAYGSGVVKQANKTGPPPLTDFIIATPSARAFHAANLKQHPSHYPLYARLIGPGALSWMTDKLGAGLWYVTMVKFGDLEVKYGILSTATLTRDLEQWETLYVAGRLHKPVLTLHLVPSLRAPLEANTRAALCLALLNLPPQFTELELWEKVAGISYSGDPRMSVPGAENPEKVRNIVRGPGVLGAFRGLYAPHVGGVGLRWADTAAQAPSTTDEGLEWRGTGENTLTQPASHEHAAALLAALPLRVRQRLAAHFRPTVAAALLSREVAAERREIRERRAAAKAAKESRALYDDAEFWRRVAAQEGFVEVVNNEVRHIIKRPALTQSVKGLVTAGFRKSVVYSLAKFRKWLAGRRKK